MCVNIVVLETQGPCRSVHRCNDDTVTNDTCVQIRCHTRNSWCYFRKMSKNENWLERALKKMTCRSLRKLRTCGGWEHPSYHSVLNKLHVANTFNNFTRTKSVLMISCVNLAIDKHYKHVKYLVSGSCNRSCSSFDALHFLSLALMTKLSSVGPMSKIHVLNVSVNRQNVIVFVKQSDSMTDVWIQRR